MSIAIFFLCGIAGALSKDIIKDNSLELPNKKDGKLMLGFLGGTITGGIAGMFVDGNPVTAFLAGYAGTSVIEGLLVEKKSKTIKTEESIEKIIRQIAKEEKVDPDLAIRVAECESGLNPTARNYNSPDSVDRGLFQINSKYHPHVSDIEADNPEFATRFFCKAFKEGNLCWWNATKSCWEK